MKKRAIRFAVADGKGKRAASWNCWTQTGKGDSDVYLACRELKGAIKTSLHQSGEWHVAFSPEFAGENLYTSSTKLHERAILQWPRPPQIAPGVTLALRIVTPYSAVTTDFEASSSGKITFISLPPENRAVEIDMVITAASVEVTGWPGKNSMSTQLVDSMPLDNGEIVWIVYRTIEIPNLGTMRGTPTYFKGRTKEDLIGADLRIVVFGDMGDGSRVIIDSIVSSQ